MAEKIIKGVELVVESAFTSASKDIQTVYFVRTNSGKTDGYIYFNNKKYGTGKDLEAALVSSETKYTNFKVVGDAIRDLQSGITGLDATVTASTLSGWVKTETVQTDGKLTSTDIIVSATTLGKAGKISSGGTWIVETGVTGQGLAIASDVAKVIVDNEKVTAAALNDLDSRLLTVSGTVKNATTAITSTTANGFIKTSIAQKNAKVTGFTATATVNPLSGLGITQLADGTWSAHTSHKTTDGLATSFDVADKILADEKVIAAALNINKTAIETEAANRTAAINALTTSLTKTDNYVNVAFTQSSGKVGNLAVTVTAATLSTNDNDSFRSVNGRYSGRTTTTNANGLAKAENIDAVLVKDEAKIAAALNSISTSVTHNKVKIVKITEGLGTGISAAYELRDNNGSGATLGARIDILKDQFLKSVTVVEKRTPTDEPTGSTYTVGHKYLKFVFINAQGGEDTVYVDVQDLQDQVRAISSTTSIEMGYVTAGTTTAGTIYSRIKTNGVVTAHITDKNVTKAKLEDSVQASLDKADTAVQEVNGITGTSVTLNTSHIKVGANITGITDITSAKTATEAVQILATNIVTNYSKTLTSITSSDSSITVTNTTGNKTDVVVNLEASTTTTRNDGHIEITKNDSGAIYGVMYFRGADVD